MHRRESFSLSDGPELSGIKKTVTRELELRKSNSSVEEPIPEHAILPSEVSTPNMVAVDKQLRTSQLGIGPLGLPNSSNDVPSVTSTNASRATSASHPEEMALNSSPPFQPTKGHKTGLSASPQVMRNLAENLRTPKPTSDTPKAPLTPTPAHKGIVATKVSGIAASQTNGHSTSTSNRTVTAKQAPIAKKKPVIEESVATKEKSAVDTDVKPAEAISTTEEEAPARPGAQRSTSPHAKPRTASGTVTTGGFLKPRPRSPTRPVKLPAHLVAPTASSSAKHGDSPPSQRTLSRRASTISNASRRPQKPPQNARSAPTPAPRSPVAAAPASFLERMMRPTASSASKVKDRIAGVPGKK